jgi:heme exporter protein B
MRGDALQPPGSQRSGVWHALTWACRRDLRVATRNLGEIALVLAFFMLTTGLFPLALGSDPKLLARVAPGIFWVAALLSALLALPRLFDQDFRDGTLEHMLLSPQPWLAIVSGKIIAHWLTTGLPLACLAPLLALQFGLSVQTGTILVVSLLIGAPVLSLVGAVCAALTLSTRGGSTLLALMALPLFVPILIFGAGAVDAASAGLGASGHLSLATATLLLAIVLCPLGAAFAVRIAFE